MVYLDYAANTPVLEEVLTRYANTERDYFANPNASHPLGAAARQRLDECTKAIASLLRVEQNALILTSGASEANNLALKGIAHTYRHFGRHIITSCLEHPSVSGCLTYLQEQGYEVELVDIGADGRVRLDHLRQLLRKDTILVSICTVDSELGSIQPVDEIARLVGEYPNCRFHTDATQAAGKIPVDFYAADCTVFAPHKFYGLTGSGGLVKKPTTVLTPLIHGGAGSQQVRAGTPSVAHAVAMEAALRNALAFMEERYETVQMLRSSLLNHLTAYPAVRINSQREGSPYILNLSVNGVKAALFKQALERYGVCVSVKSACSTENTPSRAVYAVTGDKKNALSSFRISLSHLTTAEEIDGFFTAFGACYYELTKG